MSEGQAPICQVHNTPMRWVTGQSKTTGKDYALWSCNQKNPDGSWCRYKPNKKPGGAVSEARGDQMGRNNIAAAMIRAGQLPTMENLQLAETWFKWSRGDMPHVQPKIGQSTEQPNAYTAAKYVDDPLYDIATPVDTTDYGEPPF